MLKTILCQSRQVSKLLRHLSVLSFPQGKCVKWVYFYPSTQGLQFRDKLIRHAELAPGIDQVYTFAEVPEAFERTRVGHLRGKLVIDMLPTS